jgi:hypothetical protein
MELSKLNNAFFVKVYEDSQRVYAWFGGLGVSIYDLELNEIDYFTMAETSELYGVIRTIELHEDEIFLDEDCTDDMFITHEMETGFWQEKQT